MRGATLRRRLAWVALVVLLGSVGASLRIRHRNPAPASSGAACVPAGRDSVELARIATDTIGRLRARPQRVSRFAASPDGVEVRTEDDDPLAAHDGGMAAFDCAGRLGLLWLDGG